MGISLDDPCGFNDPDGIINTCGNTESRDFNDFSELPRTPGSLKFIVLRPRVARPITPVFPHI